MRPWLVGIIHRQERQPAAQPAENDESGAVLRAADHKDVTDSSLYTFLPVTTDSVLYGGVQYATSSSLCHHHLSGRDIPVATKGPSRDGITITVRNGWLLAGS